MAESVETREEIEAENGGEASYWKLQLELADKDHKDFLDNGRDVLTRYKSEKKKAQSKLRRINILYSNTETLKSSVYARQAKPDVRRRFADQDKIGRQVAEIIERCLSYCNDTYDSDDPVECAIDDYLLPGRGIVRVDYEPTIEGEGAARKVTNQELTEKYWYWEDFRHEPARKWSKVNWIAFRWLFSRDDLTKNFGDEHGKLCPLNWTPDKGNDKLPDAFKRAEVWEIWDKVKRKRYWVCKGYADILRTDEDPYKLQKFYPIAKPLQAVTTNDTFIPEPEFFTYKDQADGLDEIENRIDRLTRALKRRGVYDATIKELEGLRNAADNQFIPVKSYTEFVQKGGLEAAFQTEDITTIAKVLGELHIQRDLRVQSIYEITGISDIFRGATDPNETLGAQQMKANFGGARLKKRQNKIQQWIRDTLRIKAELLAEHFEPVKLQEMSGISIIPEQPQLPPPPQIPPTAPPEAQQQAAQQYQAAVQQVQAKYKQAVAEGDQIIKVMRSDKLRSYRVDVETDSTVFEDDAAQKQARTELLTAMTEFIVAWTPVVQAKPEMLPLAFEMLSFGARGFKQGRSLEDAIEQTKLKLEQAAGQQQQQVPPEVQAEQAKMASEKQAADLKAQGEQQKADLDTKARAQEASIKEREMELKEQALAAAELRAIAQHDREMEKAAADMAAAEQKAKLDEQAQTFQRDMDSRDALDKHDRDVEMRQFDSVEKDRKERAANENEHVDRLEPVIEALKGIVDKLKEPPPPRKIVRDKAGMAVGIQ